MFRRLLWKSFASRKQAPSRYAQSRWIPWPPRRGCERSLRRRGLLFDCAGDRALNFADLVDDRADLTDRRHRVRAVALNRLDPLADVFGQFGDPLASSFTSWATTAILCRLRPREPPRSWRSRRAGWSARDRRDDPDDLLISALLSPNFSTWLLVVSATLTAEVAMPRGLACVLGDLADARVISSELAEIDWMTLLTSSAAEDTTPAWADVSSDAELKFWLTSASESTRSPAVPRSRQWLSGSGSCLSANRSVHAPSGRSHL